MVFGLEDSWSERDTLNGETGKRETRKGVTIRPIIHEDSPLLS